MKYITPDGEIRDFEWKTPYNHSTEIESARTGLLCEDPSLAQQHQKDEADINTIVKRFGITGTLPQVQLPPTYADFDEVFDFQTAMDTMARAKFSFSQLPAETRSAFNNDPHRFVQAIDAMLSDTDDNRKKHNMTLLRAMNLAVEPGPVADQTTLGDLLAAIKEGKGPGDSPAPAPAKGA